MDLIKDICYWVVLSLGILCVVIGFIWILIFFTDKAIYRMGIYKEFIDFVIEKHNKKKQN